MFVEFASYRITEYLDMRAFYARAGRWLATREGENSYLLSELALLLSTPSIAGARAFVVEDREAIVAAGVLFSSGCLLLTWVPTDALPTIAEQLAKTAWPISAIFAPGHVSWSFAEAWGARTHQRFEFDRAERIYQLARNSYELPADGRLEVATVPDMAYLTGWMEGFVQESRFEMGTRTVGQLLKVLLDSHSLFIWKTDQPMSMAAMVAPTPRGASINFVYTPPQHRGQGYGKAVVAALGAKMLASDRKYCFIFADTDDHKKHKLFQQVGARTVCEFLRCTLHAKTPNNRRNLMGAEASYSRL